MAVDACIDRWACERRGCERDDDGVAQVVQSEEGQKGPSESAQTPSGARRYPI